MLYVAFVLIDSLISINTVEYYMVSRRDLLVCSVTFQSEIFMPLTVFLAADAVISKYITLFI